MKVRLKYKKLEDLPSKARQEILRKHGGYNLYYLEDREYTVYGMVFWDNNPMYYICEDNDENYPTPNPADFFEIVDDRFSKYWKLYMRLSEDGLAYPKFVFSEWRDDDLFYEKLLDGDPEMEEIFLKYKKLMDEEFMDR